MKALGKIIITIFFCLYSIMLFGNTPEDSIKTKKISIKLIGSINYTLNKNYFPTWGEMGVFLRPRIYLSAFIALSRNDQFYHIIGLKHVGFLKSAPHDEDEGISYEYNQLEGFDKHHFTLQLYYGYRFLFFKKKWRTINPYAEISVAPFYREIENVNVYLRMPTFYEENEFLKSFGIQGHFVIGTSFCLDKDGKGKLFFEPAIRLNIYSYLNEKYMWNNKYIWGEDVHNHVENSGLYKSVNHLFPDYFYKNKFFIEMIMINFRYNL